MVGSVKGANVYKLESSSNNNSFLKSIETSKAGSSYLTVLNEIFDIEELFDVVTEQKFIKFYKYKKDILAGEESRIPNWLNLAKELSGMSIEVNDIVGRELRQVSRIMQKDLNI